MNESSVEIRNQDREVSFCPQSPPSLPLFPQVSVTCWSSSLVPCVKFWSLPVNLAWRDYNNAISLNLEALTCPSVCNTKRCQNYICRVPRAEATLKPCGFLCDCGLALGLGSHSAVPLPLYNASGSKLKQSQYPHLAVGEAQTSCLELWGGV
jgi:hypothetical protein